MARKAATIPPGVPGALAIRHVGFGWFPRFGFLIGVAGLIGEAWGWVRRRAKAE